MVEDFSCRPTAREEHSGGGMEEGWVGRGKANSLDAIMKIQAKGAVGRGEGTRMANVRSLMGQFNRKQRDCISKVGGNSTPASVILSPFSPTLFFFINLTKVLNTLRP